MLFPTTFTSLINTRGLIDSASLESHHNKSRNSGSHKWPKTFWEVYFSLDYEWISATSNTSVSNNDIYDMKWTKIYLHVVQTIQPHECTVKPLM